MLGRSGPEPVPSTRTITVMVPRRREEVTAAWLATVIAAETPGNQLVGVTLDEVATGVGLLTTVVRARLHWSSPGGGPASVIVKLPSTDPANRLITTRFGYGRREVGAYRELLQRARGLVPRCHLAEMADDDAVLVLADLAEHRPADQVVGATADEALAAADLLAGIHARFWCDEALRSRSWLPGPTDTVVAAYGDLFRLAWPAFVDTHADWLTPELTGAAERAIEHFDDACERFSGPPYTLLHGDARLDNLLFDAAGGAVAIDWQLAAWGRGPYDLAFFAAGSLDPELRRHLGDDLLARYHRSLVAAGVDDYPRAELVDDYRLGHVQNLPNPITAAVAVTPGNERGRRLLVLNAQRALAALVELGF